MPELPEVETVARQLAPVITGRTIRAARIGDARLHGGRGLRLSTANLRGWRIAHVARCGKQVVLELAGPAGRERFLVVHLRMTGRLQYFGDGLPPAAHRRLTLELDSGRLGFCDARRFGTVELHNDPSAFRPRGLDPLAPAFTAAHLAQLLAASPQQQLKPWLLRQDRLVGLGNIYACEALHAAGLSPRRRAGDVGRGESARLHRAIRRVLTAAIRHCGTTFSDFQDSHGRIGGYQRYLQVYGRAGQPCRQCGGPVQRLVQQQRSTFDCPACQR